MTSDNNKSKGIGFGIISIVVITAIAVAFVTVFLDGLNQFTPESVCNAAGCFFNSTCLINSSQEGLGSVCTAPENEPIPLQALIITALSIIFAAAIFLFIVRAIKKKL